MYSALRLTIVSVAISACATQPVTIPPTPEVPPAAPDTGQKRGRWTLRLSPGITRYDFTQTADIRLEGSTDTSQSTITTGAILSVAVTPLNDSTYEVLVSADSVVSTPAGSIPSRTYSVPVSLGPILRLQSGRLNNEVQVLLPDSLCAHTYLIAMARELLLPALPAEVSVHGMQSWVDSVQIVTCPAGSRVNVMIIRQIQDLGTHPPEFSITGASMLDGTGMLRRDSLTVTGSVRSQGKAFMNEASRLPTLVQAHSEGRIFVRLGDSTSVFRQVSTHQIRQRHPN